MSISMAHFLQWLHDLPVSGTVRESLWVFPTLECIHIYSMIFLITAVAAFDLRLGGFHLTRNPQPLSKLARWVLLWTPVSLAVNFVTGAFLFASKAPEYYVNSAFRVKMLLVLAGVVYHAILLWGASKWDVDRISLVARVAGGLSLLFWLAVIGAARWIAFA
jgi:hypothetical protein